MTGALEGSGERKRGENCKTLGRSEVTSYKSLGRRCPLWTLKLALEDILLTLDISRVWSLLFEKDFCDRAPLLWTLTITFVWITPSSPLELYITYQTVYIFMFPVKAVYLLWSWVYLVFSAVSFLFCHLLYVHCVFCYSVLMLFFFNL